jgi:hypothetical protein
MQRAVARASPPLVASRATHRFDPRIVAGCRAQKVGHCGERGVRFLCFVFSKKDSIPRASTPARRSSPKPVASASRSKPREYCWVSRKGAARH